MTDQNRGWTGHCSVENMCLNLHEKWYLKENMVGTTIARDQIPDIRWTYTKGIINLREALMIRSTSFPWALTQSSRSTPTSPMHNLSFTSHFRRSCSVEILSGKIPEVYDSWKLSSSHSFRAGIGSTHRGILGTYTTSFNRKYHQLRNKAWLRKQRIQFTKGIMYPRKRLTGLLNMKDVVV